MPLFGNLRHPSRPIGGHTTDSAAEILHRSAALFYSNIVVFLLVSAALHQCNSIVVAAVQNCSSPVHHAYTELKPPLIQNHPSLFDRYPHRSLIRNYSSPVERRPRLRPRSLLRNHSSPVNRYPRLKPRSLIQNLSSDIIPKSAPLPQFNPLDLFVVAWRVSAIHIFGSIVIYPALYGLVSIKVVEELLGHNRPIGWSNCFLDIYHGLLISANRWFSRTFVIEWASRALISQFLGVYVFCTVNNLEKFLHLLLMYNFNSMFEIKTWVAAIVDLIWSIIDILGFVGFAVDSWSLIMGERWVFHGLLGAKEIQLREGWSVLGALFSPAFVIIKALEILICGYLGKLVLKIVFVEGCVIFLQSVMTVYFKVALLLCFFAAARQKDSTYTYIGRCRV